MGGAAGNTVTKKAMGYTLHHKGLKSSSACNASGRSLFRPFWSLAVNICTIRMRVFNVITWTWNWKQRCQTHTATSLSSSGKHWVIPKSINTLQQVLGLPWSLLLVQHAQNTLPRSRPVSILVRCLNHLKWLFSVQTNNSSTLSPSQITKVLTHLWGRAQSQISFACILCLILSVTTQRSCP